MYNFITRLSPTKSDITPLSMDLSFNSHYISIVHSLLLLSCNVSVWKMFKAPRINQDMNSEMLTASFSCYLSIPVPLTFGSFCWKVSSVWSTINRSGGRVTEKWGNGSTGHGPNVTMDLTKKTVVGVCNMNIWSPKVVTLKQQIKTWMNICYFSWQCCQLPFTLQPSASCL